MLQSDTPYIAVPMEVMDKLNHQLFIFRANCPEHLKGSLDFAFRRFQQTALYMHGKDNPNAKVEPANYKFPI